MKTDKELIEIWNKHEETKGRDTETQKAYDSLSQDEKVRVFDLVAKNKHLPSKALLIGVSRLISAPLQRFNLWSCGVCSGLFNASEEMIFKEVQCPCCKNKISLSEFTTYGI